MSAGSIIYEKDDPIALITINSGKQDNAIDASVAAELEEVCGKISIDDSIRVVIITGSGLSFATGLAIEPQASPKERLNTMPASVGAAVARLRCPTIAAINGDALGQGFELALACDLRVAVETAHFALPHIEQGLMPWDGGTQRLSRIAGITRTMEMVLTGKSIDVREALSSGIISRIVSSEELMTFVMKMGHDIAAQSPLALSFAKEAVADGLDLTLEQGLRLECDLYMLLHTTGDRTEGIKAFLEKRTPRFKGE